MFTHAGHIWGGGGGGRLYRAVAEGGFSEDKNVSARLFLTDLTLSVLPRCAYEMAGPVGA